MAVSFDAERPLKLVKGESLEANTALRDYALMGEGRSLAKLHARYQERTATLHEQQRGQSGGKAGVKFGAPVSVELPDLPPTKRLKTLEGWSVKFGWQVRIEAWKGLLDAEEDAKWKKRRWQIREDEWEHGSEMLDLAKSILAEGPKFIRTTRRYDQQNEREIITLALDSQALVKVSEISAKLRRQAAGMETEHVKLEGTVVQVSADEMVKARERAREFEEKLEKDE
jgi:hypothetical protein